MEFVTLAWNWLLANPIVLAVIVYALLNLARRLPPPKTQPWLTLWQVFESCMVLGWERWGGPLKTFVEPDMKPKD